MRVPVVGVTVFASVPWILALYAGNLSLAVLPFMLGASAVFVLAGVLIAFVSAIGPIELAPNSVTLHQFWRKQTLKISSIRHAKIVRPLQGPSAFWYRLTLKTTYGKTYQHYPGISKPAEREDLASALRKYGIPVDLGLLP